MTTPTTPENARFNTLARLIVGVVILIFLAMAVVTFIAFPRITEGSDASVAIQKDGVITGCRAGLFTEVSRAQTNLDRARTDLEVANANLFASALAGDTAGRDAAGARLLPLARLIESFTQQLEDAQTRYEDGVTLSRTDPTAFIIKCRQGA